MLHELLTEQLFETYEAIGRKTKEIKESNGLTESEMKQAMKALHDETKNITKGYRDRLKEFSDAFIAQHNVVGHSIVASGGGPTTKYGYQPQSYLWSGISIDKEKSFSFQYSWVLDHSSLEITFCFGTAQFNNGSTKEERRDSLNSMFQQFSERWIEILEDNSKKQPITQLLESEGFCLTKRWLERNDDNQFDTIDEYVQYVKGQHGVRETGLTKYIPRADIVEGRVDVESEIAKAFGIFHPVWNNLASIEPNTMGSSESPIISEITALVESNYQVILTGPPGTGKTHLAKQVARKLLGDVSDTLQLGFVQFHPSFDYTDFVEGFRPVTGTVEGSIAFHLKNGLFKTFCMVAGVVERALFNSNIDELRFNDFTAQVLRYAKEVGAETFWARWLEASTSLFDSNELIKKLPKFVFIIDEINRAELSKVFGELMYSLEPNYRGATGKVKTQYSSSTTADTCFIAPDNEWFFIPSNVYIVGTMNDIDRSVDVFDFALRRRFAWYNVSANRVMTDVLSRMLNKSNSLSHWAEEDTFDLANRGIMLNNYLTSLDIGLDESFHIGPAYLANICKYWGNPDPLYSVWSIHIAPLLKEYVRGTGVNSLDFIKDCRMVFFEGNDFTVAVEQ